MKRLILVLNIILIGALSIGACGTTATQAPVVTEAPPVVTEAPPVVTEAPSAPTEVPVSTGEKVHVTIFVGLGTGTDPEQIDRENALAAKFNASHDKIEIDFLIVPYEQSRERFLAMISGGTAPQLVGPLGIESTGQFLDVWEDLNPYIQRDNYDIADFYGPAVSLNTYEGKNVGLPLGLYPSFIYYNESAFDAAGVDYPTHDFSDKAWTIDKLREVAMKTTQDINGNNATSPDFDPTNITQYGFDNSWGSLREWVVMWGPENMGRPTSADFKTSIVNDPDWVTSLQWYSDGIWKDHFIPDNTAISAMDPENGDLFAVGSDAMFMTNSWYMSESMNELPFKWNLAPVPFNAKGERIAQVDADVYAIPKDAKNKDEAWEVMKWLLEPENILELCDMYGCMPSRKSTETSYNATLSARYPDADLSVFFNSATYLDVPNHESWVPEYGSITDALGNAQSQITTIDQEHDAKTVLDATNAEIQKLLDAYWSTH